MNQDRATMFTVSPTNVVSTGVDRCRQFVPNRVKVRQPEQGDPQVCSCFRLIVQQPIEDDSVRPQSDALLQ